MSVQTPDANWSAEAWRAPTLHTETAGAGRLQGVDCLRFFRPSRTLFLLTF
jgi:hypothetical protein